MRTSNLKTALIATASAGALSLALGISPAAATPPSFTINPDAMGVTGYSAQVETDINGTSDALIQQTGPSQQTETGWLQIQSFTNNGLGSTFTKTGLQPEDNSGLPTIANTYGMYLTFTGNVSGITGFAPGQTGVVAPGNYTYIVYGDIGQNDVFNPGSTSSTGGTPPSVTDTGLNDVVLAMGSSVSGSVGFAPSTGAPFFDVLASFVICNGTANEGMLGGTLVIGGAAAGCGTFDALNYFTSPSPFYSLDFNSSISGSAQDLSTINPGGPNAPANATLNGVTADINFALVPEPATLAMFGSALILLGAFGWKQRRKA